MTEQDSTLRRADLAQIHLAKKRMRLDDDDYRDILERVTGKRSAADLDGPQRRQVLAELRRLGWRTDVPSRSEPGAPGAVSEYRVKMFRKIAALLGRRPWAYANAMVKHMFDVDNTRFCDDEQLRKLIAALEYDAKRKRNKKEATS